MRKTQLSVEISSKKLNLHKFKQNKKEIVLEIVTLK
jgi:hypothetical protein